MQSKKPSERRASPLQPSDLVVFIDRSCGGKKIPEAFRQLGFCVEVQREHFSDDASDQEILDACGRHSWIYVAQDFAVRKNPAELDALTRANVHAIFLRGVQRPAEWAIANLRASLPKILDVIAQAKRGVHIEVMAGG